MTTFDEGDKADSQRTSYFLDRNVKYEEQGNNGFEYSQWTEAVPPNDQSIPFARLLGGREDEHTTRLRWKLFQRAWSVQQQRIKAVLDQANDKLINSVRLFVSETWDRDSEAKVSTCILLPGSNIADHIQLFSQIRDAVVQSPYNHMVSITSKECPNLKTALKIIVGRLTEQNDNNRGLNGPRIKREDETDELDRTTIREEDEVDEDENDEEQTTDGGLRFDRRLRYDLDILVEWCKKQAREHNVPLAAMRIIICVEDTDSFPINILTGLIKLSQSYISAIPIKLMFSVATSLAVFEEKLPRQCIRLVKGKAFPAQLQDGINRLLDATMFDPQNPSRTAVDLLIGPKVLEKLVQRDRRSLQSVEALIACIKYVYMAHFYGNALSVLLALEEPEFLRMQNMAATSILTSAQLDAIRTLPSFQLEIERLIASGTNKLEIVKLLENDEYLILYIQNGLQHLRQYAIKIIEDVNSVKQLCSDRSKIDIYREMVTEHRPFTQVFLHECLVPNSAKLLSNVFTPTYRAALELGLSDPPHYWGGQIEKDSDAPILSMLYQLYRESSVYINLYDYYVAFRECLEKPEEMATDEWHRLTMAWFLHGVSELKFIGIVRDCKRKFECIEKVAWKGL